jgi:hypothetical protein
VSDGGAPTGEQKAAALRERLGIMTQDEAVENAFARILLLGPAKAGKTTCVAGTAPKPLILNCDGQSATKGAKLVYDAEFDVLDVTSRKSLEFACSAAEQMVAAGLTRTVILDTATLLADTLLDEISVTLTGWDVWTELNNCVVRAVKRLAKLEAHLFVVAHMDPSKDPAEGIMPAIGGKLKTRLPAMLDDWILLDVDPERTPQRQFLLGPQKHWTRSGRNIRRSCAVEATVPKLFAELGITL